MLNIPKFGQRVVIIFSDGRQAVGHVTFSGSGAGAPYAEILTDSGHLERISAAIPGAVACHVLV